MRYLFTLSLLVLPGLPIQAQQPTAAPAPKAVFVPNYDERSVGSYTLPDPLQRPDGTTITQAKEWENGPRDRVMALFKQNVYGQMPGRPAGLHFAMQRIDTAVLGGKAVRKFVRISFGEGSDAPGMDVMLYLPKNKTKVPVFVALNYGNHTISPDATIPLPSRPDLRPDSSTLTRGTFARRWPLEQLIDAGFGLATANYADLEPDRPTGWQTGIRTTLAHSLGLKPDQWGAIGAWAWGMSRVLDYLETDPAVDVRQIVVQGHSRLGKAALWAGANDRRFALVISNESGEGGAALARRNYGETIGRITSAFPYWFVPQYATYTDRVADLPVDQHELLALVAPRPLYVTSAQEDNWSDPRGEFLGLKAAAPVWALYGYKVNLGDWPGVDQPVRSGPLGYHVRTGKHDVMPYDWAQYITHAQAVGLVR